MSLIYKRLEDLRELPTAPFDPVAIDALSVDDAFSRGLSVREVTPLGSKPILSRSLPAWYVELVELYEFYEYIDCILPRRYSNA